MKKVFENKFVEIFDISDEIPHTICAHWKSYLSLENSDAIAACTKSLEYFKEAGIKVMISNHQYLEGATMSFLEWVHNFYFVEALKNGLVAEIILDSDHILGNITLDLMYNEQDVLKYQKDKQLFTPKIDNIGNAKLLAKQIVQKNMTAY